MKYTVDRIESGFAVCYDNDKNIIDIPVDNFSFEVYEGCIFVIKDGEYILDNNSSDDLLERINKLKEKVWKKE